MRSARFLFRVRLPQWQTHQPPKDFFKLLDVPHSFTQNPKILSGQKRTLLFATHPDRASGSGDSDAPAATTQSRLAAAGLTSASSEDACAMISEAHDTLLDPVRRICHIVQLAGYDGESLTHHRPPTEMLARLLDTHELVDEIVEEHGSGEDADAASPMGHHVMSADVAANAKVNQDGIVKLVDLARPLVEERAAVLRQMEKNVAPFVRELRKKVGENGNGNGNGNGDGNGGGVAEGEEAADGSSPAVAAVIENVKLPEEEGGDEVVAREPVRVENGRGGASRGANGAEGGSLASQANILAESVVVYKMLDGLIKRIETVGNCSGIDISDRLQLR